MKLFDVYPRFNITPKSARGVYVYNENDQQYLDLYGGHGVISIGHSHPTYVDKIQKQLSKIGFYSNSVEMPIQDELANELGKQSGYLDYNLFLCNSGAEANENALKLASFHTGKRKVIAFKGSFHGRTAAALNVTDSAPASSSISQDQFPVEFLELNNSEQLKTAFLKDDICAVIIEGIQGVGGLDIPTPTFLNQLSESCKANGAILILDEIQSGFGRSGKFFAHQSADIKPDLITVAKGMGNGFPIAGVLISPEIKASHGMLGTTFGGNHLACAASLAVLEVFSTENLIENVEPVSDYLVESLKSIPAIKQIKGKGLMLGIDLGFPVKELRSKILSEDFIFTGASANPNLLRILPPLCITTEQITPFISSLKKHLS
jgi:acetylornithine aminotransferase